MKDFIILALIVAATIICAFIFLLTTARYRRASRRLKGTLFISRKGEILADFDESIHNTEDGEIVTLKIRRIGI